MSQATKRKHVVKEALGDFVTPTENQQIVRVLSSRGNNLHEAVTGQGETFLVSMPTKFRKNLWIKRGNCNVVIVYLKLSLLFLKVEFDSACPRLTMLYFRLSFVYRYVTVSKLDWKCTAYAKL